jgi:hypothetical protein
MLCLNLSTLILLLPPFLAPIFAKDTNLLGCNELSCPKEGTNDRCKTEGNIFLGVGLSPFSVAPALRGLSILKDVNVSTRLAGKDNDKPTRPFKSIYYRATPEDAKPPNLQGCAVIFNDPPRKKFKGSELEGRNGIDSCAATETYSDMIEQRTTNVTEKSQRDWTICDNVEQELKNDFNECSGFGGGDTSLGNFSVKSFGDFYEVKNS